jgi:hypothetical protein
VLLRLVPGGMKKLQALLYSKDPLLQARSAEVFAHCAPNKDTRITLRLADCLAPLVGLLSSPHHAARVAAAGALMQGTQATRTNQVKCRELGAIAPLLRLLEPPEEGAPDLELQRRGVWTLSNIACEPTAAKQLRQSPSGFGPLITLIGASHAHTPRAHHAHTHAHVRAHLPRPARAALRMAQFGRSAAAGWVCGWRLVVGLSPPLCWLCVYAATHRLRQPDPTAPGGGMPLQRHRQRHWRARGHRKHRRAAGARRRSRLRAGMLSSWRCHAMATARTHTHRAAAL